MNRAYKAAKTIYSSPERSLRVADHVTAPSNLCISESLVKSSIVNYNPAVLQKTTGLSIAAWFEMHFTTWRNKTAHFSSSGQIKRDKNYNLLIEMGEKILPLVFDKLQNDKSPTVHLFLLLKSITKADPVPLESKGLLNEMREFWLQWGKQKQYLQA